MSREARTVWAEVLTIPRMPCHLLLCHLPPILCLLAQEGSSQPHLPIPVYSSPSSKLHQRNRLTLPFLGLQASSSGGGGGPRGSCWCGCNPSGIGFFGLGHGIAICAFRVSFLPVLQEGVRTFCPSTGQDPAGVGNAGPNPRHQTEGQEGEIRTVLGDLDHLVTSFEFYDWTSRQGDQTGSEL